jgi:nucleolar GTP-binding protein
VKRKDYKLKASTTPKKTWYAPLPFLFFTLTQLTLFTNQFDSDDEREAAAATVALSHKIQSQSIKKSKKNQSRLPRTAGLRTLSELTGELTKAGLDPSRIQERAEMLAKVQGAKRKRAEDEDADMDEDDEEEEEGSNEGEENWMDVDGEDSSKKRLKTNSGGVVNKREPRSHRHLAGMRDEGVSFEVLLSSLLHSDILLASSSCS